MNEEIKTECKKLRDEIGFGKTLLETNDINGMFLSLETIISYLAYMISPMTELENKYRVLKAKFIEEGDSDAKAETKAKASVEYVDWKKVERLYELGHEQAMALKKFKDVAQGEYRRN